MSMREVSFEFSPESNKWKNENPEKYLDFKTLYTGKTSEALFKELWVLENNSDLSEESQFITELIKKILMSRFNWSEATLVSVLNDMAGGKGQVQFLNRPRVVKCISCGADISEEYALALTADAILTQDLTLVVCPFCGQNNMYKTTLEQGG